LYGLTEEEIEIIEKSLNTLKKNDKRKKPPIRFFDTRESGNNSLGLLD